MPPSPDDQLRALALAQHGVIRADQAIPLGLSHDDLRTRVRRGEYRRLARGILFVDAEMWPEVPWLARVQAAQLRHGPKALVGLGTAAELAGIAGHDTDIDTIDVILPRGTERAQTPGIRLHFWDVPEGSVTIYQRLRCTGPVRTLADLFPRLPRSQAVAVLDSALNRRLVSVDDIPLMQELAAHRPGAEVAANWWAQADGRAESPLETWARLDCADHHLPPDELQWTVRDRHGALLGIGDMAWLKRRRPVVGEADGAAPHGTPKALFRDRRRANNFVGAGVDIVRFTWADARRAGRCSAIVRLALVADRPL